MSDGRPRAHFVTTKDTARGRSAETSGWRIAGGERERAHRIGGSERRRGNYCFGALRRRTVTDWTVCGAISTVSEDAAGFRPSFGAMEITA